MGGDLRVCVRGFRFNKFRVLHHNGYLRITCTARGGTGEEGRRREERGRRREGTRRRWVSEGKERHKKYTSEISVLSTQYITTYFPSLPSPHHRTIIDISAPHDRPTVVNGHHFSVDINHFRYGGAVEEGVVAKAEERK